MVFKCHLSVSFQKELPFSFPIEKNPPISVCASPVALALGGEGKRKGWLATGKQTLSNSLLFWSKRSALIPGIFKCPVHLIWVEFPLNNCLLFPEEWGEGHYFAMQDGNAWSHRTSTEHGVLEEGARSMHVFNPTWMKRNVEFSTTVEMIYSSRSDKNSSVHNTRICTKK